MNWDVRFVVMSLAIQAILLWYYNYRRNLPLLKTKIFKKVLILILVTAIVNLVATEVDMFLDASYTWLENLLNIIYYVLYSACSDPLKLDLMA